ncbi:hypothetical protein KUTeg_008672 [Tegillarca granosa]|uniref:Sulfotransferase domain-containing protein n=1 Tax=Tegillarca granosa TaxID=220873 RepID=A0ABQ9FD04_TEGGR|nr:hypothetical protein KUTeg_008672 [Tegillarca granosa]
MLKYIENNQLGMFCINSHSTISGEVGGWKNWFTVAQNEEFNSIYQSEMKDSKLKLKFML